MKTMMCNGRTGTTAANGMSSAVHKLNAATETLRAAASTLKTPVPSTPSLAEEVDAELSKPENRGLIAVVDESRGTVRTFVAPVPYFARQTDPVPQNDQEARALEAERDQLTAQLPRLPWPARLDSERRIRAIEELLRRFRSRARDDIRKEERIEERKQQRGE